MDLSDRIALGIVSVVTVLLTLVFAYYFFSFFWPFIVSGDTLTTLILLCLFTLVFSLIVFAASVLLVLPLTFIGYVVAFIILICQCLLHLKNRK